MKNHLSKIRRSISVSGTILVTLAYASMFMFSCFYHNGNMDVISFTCVMVQNVILASVVSDLDEQELRLNFCIRRLANQVQEYKRDAVNK